MADERRPDAEADSEEIAAVVSALKRVRGRSVYSEPASAGCVAAIVAIVTLVLMPFIGRAFDLSGSTMMWLGIGLFLVAVAGGVSGFLGDGSGRDGIAGGVEEAIQQLLAHDQVADEGRRLEAAASILDGASVSTGTAFDKAEVARRLGAALPYVERVERILLRSNEIDPVFTSAARFAPMDAVRLLRPLPSDRWWMPGSDAVARAPRAGDLGVVLDVLEGPDESRYNVESVDGSGNTVWVAEVRDDEMERAATTPPRSPG